MKVKGWVVLDNMGIVSGGVSDRQAMLDAGFDRVIQVTHRER